MGESATMLSRYKIAKEQRIYKEALQYFVDTFGYHRTWSGPKYMQIHRTEALKKAEALGIVPKGADNTRCSKCGGMLIQGHTSNLVCLEGCH